VLRISTIATLLVVALTQTPTPETRIQRIKDSADFKQAAVFIEGDYERFVQELITLTEIPAPPFKEQQRARAFPVRCRDGPRGERHGRA
jgi:tripeptide aminopeptidase